MTVEGALKLKSWVHDFHKGCFSGYFNFFFSEYLEPLYCLELKTSLPNKIVTVSVRHRSRGFPHKICGSDCTLSSVLC